MFNKQLPPACEYCEKGIKGGDENYIQCPKNGMVSPTYHCRHYQYDPTKRIPPKKLSLPRFEKEDFTI